MHSKWNTISKQNFPWMNVNRTFLGAEKSYSPSSLTSKPFFHKSQINGTMTFVIDYNYIWIQHIFFSFLNLPRTSRMTQWHMFVPWKMYGNTNTSQGQARCISHLWDKNQRKFLRFPQITIFLPLSGFYHLHRENNLNTLEVILNLRILLKLH